METKKIEFDKISKNKDVIELLKQRDELEKEIFSKDEFALIKFEYAKLGWEDEKTTSKQQTIERLRELLGKAVEIYKSKDSIIISITKLGLVLDEAEQLLNTKEPSQNG